MIWYDARTREPVAPPEGEDGGPPSIEGYYCSDCGKHVNLQWKMHHMLCAECKLILLSA